jgi:hypothetical protein
LKVVRAVCGEVVGLFVADWVQSAVIVLILAAGWFTLRRFGPATLVPLVALLAGQMVWFARAEARRLAAGAGRK